MQPSTRVMCTGYSYYESQNKTPRKSKMMVAEPTMQKVSLSANHLLTKYMDCRRACTAMYKTYDQAGRKTSLFSCQTGRKTSCLLVKLEERPLCLIVILQCTNFWSNWKKDLFVFLSNCNVQTSDQTGRKTSLSSCQTGRKTSLSSCHTHLHF